MRYSSVECTAVLPRRLRRRLGPLVGIKGRRPELLRKTLPPAVILNRLAADFFVLIPFGRRIDYPLALKKSAQYRLAVRVRQEVFFRDCERELRQKASGNIEKAREH